MNRSRIVIASIALAATAVVPAFARTGSCANCLAGVLEAQVRTDTVKVDTTRSLVPSRDTIPIGAGSLKQDEVTMSLRTGANNALLLKVTPLQENLIRLLAPDTYRRLHAIVESRKDELSKGFGPRELFLVSFYSYQPDVEFQPQDVQLLHQGRTLRSQTIVPLTPGWGKQRMQQQEVQTAIYVFDGPIDYQQDIVLQYGLEQADTWLPIVAKLQVERANVKTRTGH